MIVTKHEFIFDDQRKHRIARHITFWLVWSVSFNLLFHFPIHVFKGWDVTGPGTKHYRELGPVLFFVKTLIVNSFLAVILPQIVLTYVLMYWLLPNYFYKKRNYFLTAVITILVFAAFNSLALITKHAPTVYNAIAGGDTSLWPYITMQWVVMIDQLTSLPIILGIALMIKLVKRWWLKEMQIGQLAKEKTTAELQLLKAQVHPHFLFNTLNNIYSFTLAGSAKTPEMIKKLSDLLTYILNDCNQSLVPLEKEIKMIEDYMALEKIRYAEHMQLTIEKKGDYKEQMIAPLLLIPFVENSFKHGASKMISHPFVKLSILVENNELRFTITNNKPSATEAETPKGNIGLKNVRKRLELIYPGAHYLNIVSERDIHSVQLTLHLQNTKYSDMLINEIKPEAGYAMA
jgi:two-component system LytT family sensor kinase